MKILQNPQECGFFIRTLSIVGGIAVQPVKDYKLEVKNPICQNKTVL
jgi:hypothetical protein